MIIAIDGESSSGKGTISKMLANKLNFAYLDTGLLYRAVAYLSIKKDCIGDNAKVIQLAKSVTHKDLDNKELRSNNVANVASEIAQIYEVRETLLSFQRNFAKSYFLKYKGAILDGRDIGTIICPDADIKFYICASLEERASRRHKDILQYGSNITYDQILLSLKQRDNKDKNRENAPLKIAKDAIIIDTTELNIHETFSIVYKHICNYSSNLVQ